MEIIKIEDKVIEREIETDNDYSNINKYKI